MIQPKRPAPGAIGAQLRPLRSKWGAYLRALVSRPERRRLSLYIAVSGALTTAQMTLAITRREPGLMSSAFHNYFHCIVLLLSLCAMVVAAEPGDSLHPYGLDRYHILAAFTNAMFLCFMALFFAMEAAHHLVSPLHQHHDEGGWVLLATFAMDAFGLGLFWRHSRLGDRVWAVRNGLPGGGRPSLSGAEQVNLHSVYLHVFSDMIWTIARAASRLAGVVWAGDNSPVPAFAVLFAALVILRKAFPLVRTTGGLMVQASPRTLRRAADKAITMIRSWDDVVECSDDHWWAVSPGVTVGTLRLRVRAEADVQALLIQAHNLLRNTVNNLTVQIEKDPPKSRKPHVGAVEAGLKHGHAAFI